MRAATLGLPLALAIIGGEPARFAPFFDLYRDAARRAGHDPYKLATSLNVHGFVAETTDGLLVSVVADPPEGKEAFGLYRHAEDIPLPTPAKAVIGDMAWLAGAWLGTRSSGSSIEERWSPPLGGAMLAVSRTVNTSGKMGAFEYLRIVERDGGLVYIAQPGGASPTEFVLTELSPTRAMFDNPRHDYPKRIVYELSAEGGLSATIGFTKGGTPRRFEFKREGASK